MDMLLKEHKQKEIKSLDQFTLGEFRHGHQIECRRKPIGPQSFKKRRMNQQLLMH
jgi:hypothetical protein